MTVTKHTPVAVLMPIKLVCGVGNKVALFVLINLHCLNPVARVEKLNDIGSRC